MSRQYYTLCTLEDGIWGAHFGDYCEDSVHDERTFLIHDGVPMKNTRILSTGDTQAAIESAVAELNRRSA